MPTLIRIIVIVAIIWLVYRLIKQWRAQAHRSNKSADKSTDKTSTSKVENVVECVVCGLHIPEKASVKHDDKQFCSAAHKKQYLAEHN